MKIRIRTQEVRITILLPNFLVLNRFTASHIIRSIAERINKSPEVNKTPDIDSEKARLFIAELRRIKRKYGRFTLVDVESSDGDAVKIIL